MNHPLCRAPSRLPRRSAMLLGAATLAACSWFPDTRQELATYGIRAAPLPAGGAPVAWQLLVEEPAASPLLDDTRIVVAPADGPYGVLRGAHWSTRAPALFQGLLVRGFEDSGRILGVGRTGSSLRGDFTLIGELRAFEVVFGPSGLGTVRVALSARLVKTANNVVVAARAFAVDSEVEARGTVGVVAAFDAAVAGMVPQVIDWALAAGEAARTAAPAR